MAVEAQHLHFSPQICKNSAMNSIENQAPLLYSNMQNSTLPITNESSNGFVCNNQFINASLLRKRSADALLNDEVSSHVYAYMLDIDRIIAQHVVNVKTELLQKRRRFENQITAAVTVEVMKKLKAKEEELEQLKRLNYAMEERMKNLVLESNAWKYLARSHESTAAALSTNLERLLAQNGVVNDDSESCCGDNYSSSNLVENCKFERRLCLNCKSGEPSVLLLPCRHLCLCAVCGPAINVCPVCNSCKSGSVNVNLC